MVGGWDDDDDDDDDCSDSSQGTMVDVLGLAITVVVVVSTDIDGTREICCVGVVLLLPVLLVGIIVDIVDDGDEDVVLYVKFTKDEVVVSEESSSPFLSFVVSTTANATTNNIQSRINTRIIQAILSYRFQNGMLC